MTLLLLCISLLALAAVEAYLVRELWYAYRSVNWPRTEVEILQSTLSRVPGYDEPDHWQSRLAYRYNASGRSFVSNRLRFGHLPFPARKQAEHVLARFPAGMRTQAFLHPTHPELTCLQSGADFLTVVIALLTLLLLVYAFFHLVALVR